MNKSKLILILIVVLIAAGGIGAFLYKTNGQKAKMLLERRMTEERTSYSPTGDKTISGSLFDLVKMGKSLKCTYGGTVEGVSMKGVTYVDGKKIKNEYESVVGGQTMKGYMISDGEWLYTWTSASPNGFKMNMADAQKTPAGPNDSQYKVQGDESFKSAAKSFDYSCDAWTATASTFDLPKDVSFVDFSKMMENFKNIPIPNVSNYGEDETE